MRTDSRTPQVICTSGQRVKLSDVSRLLALSCVVVGLSTVASLVAVGPANGAAYVVTQCEAQWNPRLDSEGYSFQKANQYSLQDNCGNPSGDPASALGLKVLTQTPTGNFGLHRWTAPAPTKIVGVTLQGRLRRDGGQKSRLKAGATTFGSGGTGSAPWTNYGWTGVGQDAVVAYLGCELSPNCNNSGVAKTQVRNVRLTIRDNTPPSVSASGPLVGGGWQRGVRGLSVVGQDVGGGTRKVDARINGTVIGTEQNSCALVGPSLATRFRPCEERAVINFANLDTTRGPFTDGSNGLRVCASDLGTVEPANTTCRDYTVNIDNAPPSGAFRNSQAAQDPEVIRAGATDSHSGVATAQIHFRRVGQGGWIGLPTDLSAGEVEARVDSTAVPAGNYEFKLEATDVAGNQLETDLREDGSQMRLTFPLKTATTLDAQLPGGSEKQTVQYRQPSKVSGTLTTAAGEPIAGQTVTVVEAFDAGSLIDRRVRTATTDGAGRYGSALPGGPSRRVSVEFEGSKRYAADRDTGLDFNVNSKANFRTSKGRVFAGKRVRFRGTVRRDFAAIPPGGKLIELQVKEGARKWGTVREAFPTRATGRYKLRHRFKRFYVEPTTFKFRVKVTREQGWPYKTPVRSRARKVTILPR